MNANILPIATICTGSIRVAPTPHKVGLESEGKLFSLNQDDLSPDVTSCEKQTSRNVDHITQKTNTNESDLVPKEKAKTECISKDQEETRSEKPNPVSDMNEQTVPEPALCAEKAGPSEQDFESGSEAKAETRIIPPISNPQIDSITLVTEETVQSVFIGRNGNDESQALLEKIPTDTCRIAPSANKPIKLEQNPGTIPIPAGTTTPAKEQTHMDTSKEPIVNTQTGAGNIKGNNENKPTITETSTAVEATEKPITTSGQGVTDNEGQTTADNGKPTTAHPHLISAQAKSSEAQPYAMETNRDQSVPTEETTSTLRPLQDQESTHKGNDFSNTSGHNTPTTNEFQTSPGQSEGQNRSSDYHHDRKNLQEIVIEKESPTPATQQFLTSVENTKTFQSLLNDTSTDVGKQIFESIQSSFIHRGGDQQITIRLNPPELGNVLIRFQEQNSEVTGLLEVTKAETRAEIEQAVPQMIRQLADCGIHIRRLDVMLSSEDESKYGDLEHQSPQNHEPYEEDSAESKMWDNETYSNGIKEGSFNNKSYSLISELQEMFVTDSSVNVLI